MLHNSSLKRQAKINLDTSENLTDGQRDHGFSRIWLDDQALHDGSYGVVCSPRDVRRLDVPMVAKNRRRHARYGKSETEFPLCCPSVV